MIKSIVRYLLKIKVFHMKEVLMGDTFKLEPDRLTIPKTFDHACEMIDQLKIQVLPPRQHDVETNTFVDMGITSMTSRAIS